MKLPPTANGPVSNPVYVCSEPSRNGRHLFVAIDDSSFVACTGGCGFDDSVIVSSHFS